MGRSNDAIEKIRQLIASGELSPGARLPREPDLAAQLGLSRSSMREAVTALVHAQVLDVRRGDGTYVTSLEPHRLLEGIAHAVELVQDDTLPEIFELRRLLEPQATALAAERITPEQLARLRGHLDAMRRSETIEELITHDAAFHACIMAATGNRTLTSVVNGLAARALRARTWNALNIADARERIMSQHQAIYEALEAGDAALALSWATIHVTASEKDLLRTIPPADRRSTSPA
ncbi:FadR/GntR family transcriptional regulator [Saccharopolyspora shandongensis]|uniref:FadR/GntR family transcriptional regulator n=1 Tax=Saccharopolyspora shandongensis TaxID=418495 RepID=UPI0033F23BC1